MKKRILSMLLVIVMVLSMVPVSALAAGELKIASTKSSKYVVIGVDEITLSATTSDGATPAGNLTWDFTPENALERIASENPAEFKFEGKTQGDVTIKVTDEEGNTGTENLTVLLPPDKLEIVKDTKEPVSGDLKVGDTVALGYTCSNEDDIDPAYITSNWKVLSVNPAGALTLSDTGVVTAVAEGEAEVRFALNGKNVTKKFTIAPADPPVLQDMTITATPDTHEMYPNRSLTLEARADDVKVEDVKWTSNDPAIATVDEKTGEVKSGPTTGAVTITAEKDGYNKATYEISIVANTFRITDASGKELAEVEELKVGQTLDLQVRDGSNTPQDSFAFEPISGDITVTEEGKLTANAKTDAPVEVTAKKSSRIVTQKFSVLNNTMVIKAGDVTLNAEDGYSVTAGNQVQLTAVDSITGETVAATWYSADTAKATVDKGMLTGIDATDAGKTVRVVVGATGYEKVTLPITVRAKGTFSRLKIQEGEKLIVNQPCHLIALDAAGNAVEGVSWELSDGTKLESNVLTVASTEVASVRVKATHPDYEEKPATFNVETVTPTEVKLTVDGEDFPAEKTMIVGDKLTLLPQFTPETISFPDDVTLTCQPAGVASVVKENGEWILEAQNPGEATLTASFGETKSTYRVVVKATTEIVLDENMPVPAEILAGEELILKAYLRDTATGEKITANVTWKLDKQSDGDYVRLDRNTLDVKPDLLGVRTIKLIATVDSAKYTAVPLEYDVTVVPKSSSISLWVDGKKVNDKETTLNLNDDGEVAAGVTIVATISPDEAGQDVVWNITDDLGIYEEVGRVAAHVDESSGEFIPASLTLVPTSAKRSGTITVKAVAKDGTRVFATTTIHFAKLGRGDLQNAPEALRGGASLDLKPYLVQDKNLDNKSVSWSLIETDPDTDGVIVKNGKSMKKGKVIATISKAGKLTTKPVTEPTPVTVKITGSDGNFTTHMITLYPAAKSVKISCDELKDQNYTVELSKEKSERTFDFEATIKPDVLQDENVWPLIWSSTNNDIATVDEDGQVVVKKAGKVRIDCMIADGSKIKGSVNLKVTSNANSVTVTPNGRTLASGKSLNMKAVIKTPTGRKAANQSVTWSITDEFGKATSAAIISATGRVTAYDVDRLTEVLVTATSKQDKTVFGSVVLTIKPNTTKTLHAIIGEDMISGSYAMNKGESVVVDAEWQRSGNGEMKVAEDCQFFSSNTNVATIDKDLGTLKAVGHGSSTITLRCVDPATQNICTSTFTVKVVKKVGTVTITAPALRDLRSGKSVTLKATAWNDYANGIKADNQGFTWEVTENGKETNVATINSSGVLTAKTVTKKHTVMVKAISKEGGIFATAAFNIFPAENVKFYFELSGKEYTGTLPVDLDTGLGGLTVRIHTAFADSKGNISEKNYNPAGVTWSTSDKTVIQITGTGPKALKVGKATLTAKYKIGNTTYESKITAIVNRTMGSVKNIELSSILVAGKSINLRAVPANSNATNKNVLWSVEPGSDSDNVAINMYTGKLSAKKGIGGYAVTVTATPVDGSTPMSTTVNVFAATTKVEISDVADKVVNGTKVSAILADGTMQFYATAEPTEAYQTSFKWSSSDTSVATVDGNGKVTIKKVGATTIKATAQDGTGKYAKFTLRVTND